MTQAAIEQLISKLSAHDFRYLTSTSFEVYMITGAIFLFGFTVSFVLSVLAHREVMLWPGALASVIVSFIVLKLLERREFRAKLAELAGEYEQVDSVE